MLWCGFIQLSVTSIQFLVPRTSSFDDFGRVAFKMFDFEGLLSIWQIVKEGPMQLFCTLEFLEWCCLLFLTGLLLQMKRQKDECALACDKGVIIFFSFKNVRE